VRSHHRTTSASITSHEEPQKISPFPCVTKGGGLTFPKVKRWQGTKRSRGVGPPLASVLSMESRPKTLSKDGGGKGEGGAARIQTIQQAKAIKAPCGDRTHILSKRHVHFPKKRRRERLEEPANKEKINRIPPLFSPPDDLGLFAPPPPEEKRRKKVTALISVLNREYLDMRMSGKLNNKHFNRHRHGEVLSEWVGGCSRAKT